MRCKTCCKGTIWCTLWEGSSVAGERPEGSGTGSGSGSLEAYSWKAITFWSSGASNKRAGSEKHAQGRADNSVSTAARRVWSCDHKRTRPTWVWFTRFDWLQYTLSTCTREGVSLPTNYDSWHPALQGPSLKASGGRQWWACKVNATRWPNHIGYQEWGTFDDASETVVWRGWERQVSPMRPPLHICFN